MRSSGGGSEAVRIKGLLFSILLLSVVQLALCALDHSLIQTGTPVPAVGSALGCGLFVCLVGGQWFLASVFCGTVLWNILGAGHSLSAATMVGLTSCLVVHGSSLIFYKLIKRRDFSSQTQLTLAIFGSALVAAALLAVFFLISIYPTEGLRFTETRDILFSKSLSGLLSILLYTPILMRMTPQYGVAKWNRKEIVLVFCQTFTACILAIVSVNIYDGILFVCFAGPFIVLASYRKRDLSAQWMSLCIIVLAMKWYLDGTKVFYNSSAFSNLINFQIFALLLIAMSLMVNVLNNLGGFRYPLLALSAGWLVNFLVAFGFYKAETSLNDERIDSFLRENISRIESRLNTYTDGLQGAAALVKTIGDRYRPLQPIQWRSFVDAIEMEKHYPGIHGIALIRRVHKSQAPEFLASAQRLMAEFEMRPVPNIDDRPLTDEHYVVTNIEPLESNRQALGVDLATEVNRKAAADQSARTRKAAVTKRIMLVQDSQKHSGFLLFLPVYDQGKNTGWVNVPLIADKFFRSISYVGSIELGFSVNFEGDDAATLYQSFAARDVEHEQPVRVQVYNLAQQNFVFRWYRLKGFSNAHNTSASWVSFAIGMISVILACFFLNLQLTRKRAEQIAEDIASDRDHHRSIAFQAAKMSMVGEMAGGIAHEINNPLAVISVTIQQIHRNLSARNVDDPMLAKLEKMSQTVLRITKIVQGLRTFSRTDDKLKPAWVSLELIIEGVLDLCRERFYHHNIQLKIQPIPPIKLNVVLVQMEQVLMNLLSNALDAIETSESSWVEIGFEKDKDFFMITVADSGGGINTEIVERIMQPFFTTKEVGKGTGLGLSISKGIMENHEGSLSIDVACPNTRFLMKLPLARYSV